MLPGNPLNIESLADLARTDVLTVTRAPEVPCGAAAHKLLDRDGVKVTPASEEQNVTAALTKLVEGEADAGLIYRSDVLRSEGAVVGLGIPGSVEAAGTYMVAPLKDAKSAAAARAFADFLLSSEAQMLFKDLGFRPGTMARGAEKVERKAGAGAGRRSAYCWAWREAKAEPSRAPRSSGSHRSSGDPRGCAAAAPDHRACCSHRLGYPPHRAAAEGNAQRPQSFGRHGLDCNTLLYRLRGATRGRDLTVARVFFGALAGPRDAAARAAAAQLAVVRCSPCSGEVGYSGTSSWASAFAFPSHYRGDHRADVRSAAISRDLTRGRAARARPRVCRVSGDHGGGGDEDTLLCDPADDRPEPPRRDHPELHQGAR